MLVGKSEIERASRLISTFLRPTPVIRSRYLSDRHGIDVFFKLEILQPTHAFKIRGAFNAIASLPAEQCKRGVICASGGNHGLGVALVASELGFPCRVFLPVKTPQIKIDAIKKLGATAILHGEALDDANRVAMQTAEREHCAYIHPFESEAVMAGQATVMIELIQQITQLDSVIVSVGGGGLISGIISACKHFAPHVKVVGVEPKGAHSLWLSMQAGHIVKIPITSVAESLGVPKTEPRQFEIISQYVNELVVVEDNQSINSLLEILSEEKILVEPAASCCVAALDTGKISIDLGKRVAIIMCGGNIGLDRVWQWFGERQIK